MSPPSSSETAVFPDDRFGIAQPRGPVTAKTVVEYGKALAFHPDWRPGFTEVWDVRFSPSVDLLPTDVPKLMEVERETKEALRGSTTLIITYKPLILYSVQFYARLVRPLGRTVIGVDTATEAAEILGISALPDLQQEAGA